MTKELVRAGKDDAGNVVLQEAEVLHEIAVETPGWMTALLIGGAILTIGTIAAGTLDVARQRAGEDDG